MVLNPGRTPVRMTGIYGRLSTTKGENERRLSGLGILGQSLPVRFAIREPAIVRVAAPASPNPFLAPGNRRAKISVEFMAKPMKTTATRWSFSFGGPTFRPVSGGHRSSKPCPPESAREQDKSCIHRHASCTSCAADVYIQQERAGGYDSAEYRS